MPVEEGERYRLKEITFAGNKAVADTHCTCSVQRSRTETF